MTDKWIIITLDQVLASHGKILFIPGHHKIPGDMIKLIIGCFVLCLVCTVRASATVYPSKRGDFDAKAFATAVKAQNKNLDVKKELQEKLLRREESESATSVVPSPIEELPSEAPSVLSGPPPLFSFPRSSTWEEFIFSWPRIRSAAHLTFDGEIFFDKLTSEELEELAYYYDLYFLGTWLDRLGERELKRELAGKPVVVCIQLVKSWMALQDLGHENRD